MNTMQLSYDEVIALARAIEFYIEQHKQPGVQPTVPLSAEQMEVITTVFHLLRFVGKLPEEYEVQV